MPSPRLPLFLFLAAATSAAPAQAPALSSAFERVLWDDPGTGTWWVVGSTWKGSFDANGFTYVPWLGPKAPRDFPVKFRVARVTVGGRELPFAARSAPTRTGDRITFDRGALREIYDVGMTEVEQTFVVDTSLHGDVQIELAFESELEPSSASEGIALGNAFGGVRYGAAFAVNGAEKLAIPSHREGQSIRLLVPASARGTGPVVVDPIIGTQYAGYQPLRTHADPDLSYDSSNDIWLAVWESPWSATDTDVFCEMFDGQGNRIVGSGAIVDASTLAYSAPRVANLNIADRFLIVVQRVDPSQYGGRSMIFSRARDAGNSRTLYGELLISSPNFVGDHFAPSIGGDTGTDTDIHNWLVTWTFAPSATRSDVHGQLVGATGQLYYRNDVVIESDLAHRTFASQVSRKNTAGIAVTPHWFVVYSKEITPGTDYDVIGRRVMYDGKMPVAAVPIDTGLADDRYPHVSSPIPTTGGTEALFLVTYEEQHPLAARAVLCNASSGLMFGRTDLTQRFAFGFYSVRAESDGIRFAVTANVGTNPSTIAVATLAFDGSSLVMHEAPRVLPGLANTPRIASRFSGAGRKTSYGIVYTDDSSTPTRTRLAFYEGYASGVQIMQTATACNGVQTTWSGQPLLGEAMQFSLDNLGGDTPGWLVGFPDLAPTALCSTCAFGVRLDQPIVVVYGTTTLDLPIPPNVNLVGASVAVQGFGFGRSTCLGPVSLGDTYDLTVR